VPGDLVAEEDQLVEEIVFVVQGRLVVQFGLGSNGQEFDVDELEVRKLATSDDCVPPRETNLETGAWFGEACLLKCRRIRTATFVAATETELAVLPAREYFRIVQKYPRLLERHQNIEEAMRDGRMNVADLAFRKSGSRALGSGRRGLASQRRPSFETLDELVPH